MSSSSSYEPDEDEASDSDIERVPGRKPPTSKAPNPPSSSPHVEELRLSSEPHEHDGPIVGPQAVRITRQQAHEKLLLSLPVPSVNAYSKILAEAINDASPVPMRQDYNYYEEEQLGAVFWSDQEKEIFFRVLQRKGKNGIKEIANAIGTKSELEVQEFLRLLHRGLERQHLVDRRHTHSIILGDVPAAAEIGDECCKVLEEYSKVSTFQEEQALNVAGKKKCRDMWIIDQELAQEMDRKAEDEGNDFPSYSIGHFTAKLFYMENWIRLSDRFFMNAGGTRAEDNWRNIAFEGEVPSMTADGFSDFYALAISLTRRLVQSALFFAMSRLRSSGRSHGLVKTVRAHDVRAALNVLNMKHNRSEFWIGLPRRCSLDVADLRNRKGWKASYKTYDDVEDILSKRLHGDTSHERSVSTPREENPPQNDSIEDDGETSNENENAPRAPLHIGPVDELEEELPTDLEDKHAEIVDHKTSTLEEVHLWKTLGLPIPANIDIPVKSEDEGEGDPKVMRKPNAQRKTKEEMVDWRDRILYRNDWEQHGEGIFDIYDRLSESRRKRRRTEEERSITGMSLSLSDSDADTEMDSESDTGTSTAERPRAHHSSHPSEADVDEMDVDEDENLTSGRRHETATYNADSDSESDRSSPFASRKGKTKEQSSKQQEFKSEAIVESDSESIPDQNTHSEANESARKSPSGSSPHDWNPKEEYTEDEESAAFDTHSQLQSQSEANEGTPKPELFSSNDYRHVKVESKDEGSESSDRQSEAGGDI
ncbi:hypothetical protein PHISCL_00433 [Aspergillus sclerotialis]|uniref:Myb-like domain-containing protein n=1 Tax=Aspergillus sclerotialis TaxID=2070753 RepID=A0A3A2ZVP3_9EURO|nr:hypothetical protein PHISCL_00433 [Aspergillus sclerotialis]